MKNGAEFSAPFFILLHELQYPEKPVYLSLSPIFSPINCAERLRCK